MTCAVLTCVSSVQLKPDSPPPAPTVNSDGGTNSVFSLSFSHSDSFSWDFDLDNLVFYYLNLLVFKRSWQAGRLICNRITPNTQLITCYWLTRSIQSHFILVAVFEQVLCVVEPRSFKPLRDVWNPFGNIHNLAYTHKTHTHKGYSNATEWAAFAATDKKNNPT